jgi:AraC-like DNA-binding protein
MLAPIVGHAFSELGVSAAIWVRDSFWHPIHAVPNVTAFERELGVLPRRWVYDRKCLTRASRERRVVLGEHAGFHDLFVPIHDRVGVEGVLVAGPFATARPSASRLRELWYALRGSYAHPNDASFASYVRAVLSTLTLQGSLPHSLESLMKVLAALMVGSGDPTALAAQSTRLRQELSDARFSERMWEAVRWLIGDEIPSTWVPLDHRELADLGIQKAPEHVLVGLFMSREELDPIEHQVRVDALQHASVSLVRRYGNALASPVGDRGVVLLVDQAGGAARARARLVDLGTRATALARRFGFRLHLGVAPAEDGSSVAARYHRALAAAEKALTRGQGLAHAEPQREGSAAQLRHLRSELGRSAGAKGTQLAPLFDRYAEAVVAHAGPRLEAARANLQAGLERLIEPLAGAGFLDPKSLDELCAAMDRNIESSRSTADLLAECRRLVSEVDRALRHPTGARHDRGIDRARDFIREHLAEPLTLEQVARVAGYAPDYFSRLFKKGDKMGFARYLHHARIERAKQLLYETKLTLEQVQRLCGFRTRGHFHRAFKAGAGRTPTEYREIGP